jgi:hypothetical protein
MLRIEELHNKAMDIAEEAFLLKRKGEEQRALTLFTEAVKYEIEAASLLPLDIDSEPTRSILYRSSAALAQNAKQFDLAERLIANGLAGFPPPEIQEELRNLYEDINYMRHLSFKGMLLDSNQWIMSLHGNATRFGGAAADQLMMRVDRVTALFYRTVERLLKLPYRTAGGINKEIKERYGLYINAFLPASFAVSFQMGKPDPQLKLFPEKKEKKIVEPSDVVDEILHCFELFEGEKQDELRGKFENNLYYENFVGIAKLIAPDGEDIKQVGFTSIRGGKEYPVALRAKRRELRETNDHDVITVENQKNSLVLTGVLIHANTPISKKYGSVKLRNHESKKMDTIHVPISIMKDVVQPFYEEDVIIYCHKEENKIMLDEIAPNRK